MKIRHLYIIFVLVLVLAVPIIVLAQSDGPLAPTNISVNPNQGRPGITWAHDTTAEYYHLYISSPDFSNLIHDQWYSVGNNSFGLPKAICSGLTCTAKPNINPGSGTYVVWMRSWGNNSPSTGGVENSGWNKSSNFSISNARPANTTAQVANTSSGDIIVNWQGANFATWYQLWIGTSQNSTPSYQPKYTGWHLAEDLGCENAGTCTFDPGGNLPDGEYEIWMQVYGPAGFSTDSDAHWFLASTFTVGQQTTNNPTNPENPGTENPGSSVLSSVEQQVLDLLNADRKAAGLGCLVANAQLQTAARRHSTDHRDNFGPNTNPQISHTGSDGSKAGDRITDAGYNWRTYGENVAVGQSTAQQVYTSWFNSAGHKANMFNANFHEIGISLVEGGGWGFNWTMALAARNSSESGACP